MRRTASGQVSRQAYRLLCCLQFPLQLLDLLTQAQTGGELTCKSLKAAGGQASVEAPTQSGRDGTSVKALARPDICLHPGSLLEADSLAAGARKGALPAGAAPPFTFSGSRVAALTSCLANPFAVFRAQHHAKDHPCVFGGAGANSRSSSCRHCPAPPRPPKGDVVIGMDVRGFARGALAPFT